MSAREHYTYVAACLLIVVLTALVFGGLALVVVP